MTEPHLFWTIFSAVLSAIILGGAFFWAAITYSRYEREGIQNSGKGNMVFICLMVPILFWIGGTLIALDKIPAWLDHLAQ